MTDDVRTAAQAAFSESEVSGDDRESSLKKKENRVRLWGFVKAATDNLMHPRIMIIGGDDRTLQLNWPHNWKVSHYDAAARNLEAALRGGGTDLVLLLTRWAPRAARKLVDKALPPGVPMLQWDGTPVRFVQEVNKLSGREDVPAEFNWPPQVLKAKTVKELLRALLSVLDMVSPDTHPCVENMIILCRGMREAVPVLRPLNDEKLEDMVRGAWAAIQYAEHAKEVAKEVAKEKAKLLAEEEVAKPKRFKPEDVKAAALATPAHPEDPGSEPHTIVEETVSPKKPKDPEFENAYKAVGALVSDSKRKDAWTKDELEMLIAAWEEARSDADALLGNLRTLGSKRSVTSILFQIQRVASVVGLKVPQAVIDRLRDLSLDDRKKSTLGIVEFIERKAGSTGLGDADVQEAREKMWNESFAAPGALTTGSADKFRALVAYVVQGVELGLETKDMAFDKIAALVKRA
jgi:hypothetical protein